MDTWKSVALPTPMSTCQTNLPVALLANYLLERRVPILPLVSGAVVIVFGGLTLILQDELFIKLYSDLPKEIIFQRELLIARL